MQQQTITSPGLFWPWPAKKNLIRRGAWEKGNQMRTKMRALVDKELEEHFETYDPEQTRDFIDRYIHEIGSSHVGSSFHGTEGRK